MALRTPRQPAFRAPLLDRLADDAPDQAEEPVPLRWHDAAAAAQSVRDELSRLLNTRRATPTYADASSALTIIDYGMADWSGFAATQPGDHRRIERQLSQLIRRFEPRIVSPRVQLSPEPGQAGSLRLQISGQLAGDHDPDPVLFLSTVVPAGARGGA